MNRNEQPLWLAHKAEAARKKADYWEARAGELEGMYHEAMVEWFPWAYGKDGELLPDDEREAACRADIQAMAVVHSPT